MLNRLAIRNYALIDDLDISFGNQLNIITGETGAGKSIILGALSLLLGQRAESKYFFNQQKKCTIEGTFKVSEFALAGFFEDNDLDYEFETVLRREIAADGKSRAFINDTPVNLATLKQLGEKLIDIHSQHATLEINDENFQLMVLDIVAENQGLLNSYNEIYTIYRSSSTKLRSLIEVNDQSKTDLDYYQFQFDELESANLEDHEQSALEHELSTLTHAEEIKRSLQDADHLLNESENSVLIQIKNALQQLQQAEKFNTQITELVSRLQSNLIEIKDIASEIERIDFSTNVNAERPTEINERLNIIYTLQKKHRVSSNSELLKIKQQFADNINEVLFGDEGIEKLKSEITKQQQELAFMAAKLSENRRKAAPDLELQVQLKLNEMGMANAILRIETELLPDNKISSSGIDKILFLFSANKGQQPLPMNKVASGGELSRLMLSIKSLIAKHTALPTIIFDEIDSGISGEIALKVGYIMEALAENMQVIAITHLPQIASKGQAHYRVFKDEQTDTVQTNIRLLDANERITEIAKMLSGERPGEFALETAKELLNQ